MSEHTPEQPPHAPIVNQGGFEDESDAAAEANARRARPVKADRLSVLKANFNSVFGHGIGKAGLIIAGVFVLVAGAFAMRGLNGSKAPQLQSAQVDVPRAPAPDVSVDPLDPKEAERRSQQAALEADIASQKGQTYQPGFNAVITQEKPSTGQATLNVPGQDPAPVTPPVPPVQVALPAETAQQTQQAQQEEQRRQAELDKQRTERDKYIAAVRGGVTEQAGEMLQGKGKEAGFGGRGIYSTISYMPVAKPAAPASAAGNAAMPASATAGDSAAAGAPTTTGNAGVNGAAKKKILFKAGSTAFATLDSEVNTDDGGEVFATMHGGKFNGARLIGKIEQGPRNIRLRFSILAPQDDRPTTAINAIAIREEDAKQGVAETIDNHTLSRYTALLAGSILAGVGRAALEPQGDTIVLPNGQVVISQPELSNKRIAMYALGEVGNNAGAEVRKNFSQPPTYITPANKGIGLIFLTDATEQ
jgi:intracellular multiplication protein IcmE